RTMAIKSHVPVTEYTWVIPSLSANSVAISGIRFVSVLIITNAVTMVLLDGLLGPVSGVFLARVTNVEMLRRPRRKIPKTAAVTRIKAGAEVSWNNTIRKIGPRINVSTHSATPAGKIL